MSGGIDTGYGDHFDDADKMVERAHSLGLVMTPEMEREFAVTHQLHAPSLPNAYRFWEGKGVVPATDDAADQPNAGRSVRG